MALRVRAGPSERLAGFAFLLFTIMQVPYMAVHNKSLGGPSMLLLSPLQITAGNVAARFPYAAPIAEAALFPGAWVREALTPLVSCRFKSNGGDCSREVRLLTDWARVRRRSQLPLLAKLVESPDFAAADLLSSGAALVTVSAAFALVVTVKSASVGFLLMAAGIMAGAHQPLPPGVLVAFLCVYSGFGLGEGREQRQIAREKERKARREQRRGAAVAAAAAQGASGSGAGKAKSSGGGSGAKHRTKKA